jgi:N-acetylglucosamine kinase-like BadF-type ATPase
MRCYLGIDAGGTKTHTLIANEAGESVGFRLAGPGTWESIG